MDFQQSEGFPNVLTREELREQFVYWLQLSQTLSFSALVIFFGGLAIMLVASIKLLEGPRRTLAIASMLCLLFVVIYALSDTHGHSVIYPAASVGLLFMTLLSIVQWPVRSAWVNAPLVYGSGIGGWLSIASVWAYPSNFY